MILEFVLFIVGFIGYFFLMVELMNRWHEREIRIEEENHVRNCPVCQGLEKEDK